MKARALCVTLLAIAWGCASGGAPRSGRDAPDRGAVAATGITPGVVDGRAAHALVAAGITVVDVRTPDEFAAGHVPGAVNVPYDQLDARWTELGPPSTPLLLYCASGRRSGIAARTLREKGFTELYDLQAYSRWLAAEAPEGAR